MARISVTVDGVEYVDDVEPRTLLVQYLRDQVGKTGTVVGCHLVRRGITGDEALARVAELWKSVEKYPGRPRSPETDEQADYVRSWVEAGSAPNVADGTAENE